MQVNATTFRLFQVLTIGGILTIAGTAAYFLFNTEVDDSAVDASHKAAIYQLQTRAETYYSRLRYYDGVCASIGALDSHRCVETSEEYAVEITLTDGSYYCADSTGFRDIVPVSKGVDSSCPR